MAFSDGWDNHPQDRAETGLSLPATMTMEPLFVWSKLWMEQWCPVFEKGTNRQDLEALAGADAT